MESMKKPAIRFKGFTEDWEQRKVGDILSDIERPIVMEDDKTYQLVTVKRRNEGVVSRGFLKGKDILVKNYFQIKEGDFLISKRQVIHGANGYVPKKLDNAVVSNEYMVAVGNESISSAFWTLMSQRKEMYKMYLFSSYGVDVEKMVFNVDDWKKRSVIIPRLKEQKSIVSFFASLDNLITLHQRKYEKLQNMKKACLEKMFPQNGSNVPEIRFKGFTEAWEQRKLGDISESYSGGTPTAGKKEYYDGDIPFIRSGEISGDKTELFITDEGLNNSSAKMVQIGDILYALYGATSGEVSISKLKGAINQAILAIQPHQNYDSQFLMQWLRKSKDNIIGTYLQGGQGNLSGNIVKELIIDVPTYEEQKEIGAYFYKLDHLITLHQRELEKLQNIKKSMLEKMFVSEKKEK